MTPKQAAAVSRLSSFIKAYTSITRGLDPEYVYSLSIDPKSDRSEQIRISDLQALLAMVSPTINRYEFEVFDEYEQTVVRGNASTLEEAERKGRLFAQYQQNGPHELEIRRVEILSVRPLDFTTAEP